MFFVVFDELKAFRVSDLTAGWGDVDHTLSVFDEQSSFQGNYCLGNRAILLRRKVSCRILCLLGFQWLHLKKVSNIKIMLCFVMLNYKWETNMGH